jgi:hypothetical protein
MLVDANVSENHTAPFFRAEVAKLGSGGIYIGLDEGKKEGMGQSGMRIGQLPPPSLEMSPFE